MSKILRGLAMFLLGAVIFSLMAGTGSATVTLPNTNHWDTVSPWAQVYFGSSLDGSQSAPGSPSTSLRFRYTAGMFNGGAPDKVLVGFPEQSELWIQYYFKYSSNFYFHPVDNKQMYWYIGGSSLSTNWYVSCSSGQLMSMVYQHLDYGGYGSGRLSPNTGYNPVIQRNTWYKLVTHAKMNTGGNANGIFQLWIDDQLVFNYSNVRYLVGPDIDKQIYEMAFDPVFGGYTNEYKPAEDYFWVDYTIISKDPIGSSTPPPSASGEKTPQPPSNITIR